MPELNTLATGVGPAPGPGTAAATIRCEACGDPAPVTPFFRKFWGPNPWICPRCVDTSAPHCSAGIQVVHCEGARGHGPITKARARWQERREVHATPSGGTEVVDLDRHPRGTVTVGP